MNVLIVGAGAVGQVYGRHLARAGARVGWFVRERHAEACRRGFAFYPLNGKRGAHARTAPEHEPVLAEDVLTSPEAVRGRAWDQVYLCLSSAGIREPGLAEVLAATGDATVVMLQPGPADRAVLLAHVPAERLVSGVITVISYQAPLDGERVPEPGMAYWIPPFVPALHSGPAARTEAVVAALERGGLPARVSRDVPHLVALPSAITMPLLTGLEAAGWSFRELGRRPRLVEIRGAAREAIAIAAKVHGVSAPPLMHLAASPLVVRTLIGVGPHLVPFDVETYCRAHFTKVRAQTRLYMEGFIADGIRLGLGTTALERLQGQVPALAA